MNLKEKYEVVKGKFPYHVVLIKSGNFWYTYDSDGIICKYVFQYELKNNRIVFPNKVFNKNISKLRKLKFSYVIVYELNHIIKVDNIANSYTFYFKKYYDFYLKEVKLNKIIYLIQYNNIDYDLLYDYILNMNH